MTVKEIHCRHRVASCKRCGWQTACTHFVLHDCENPSAILPVILAVPPNGPGTKLKALLAKIGIVPTPGCACRKRAAYMDAMGSEWCGKNIDQIVGWLRDEHKKTKTVLPFIDAVARSLVRLAVRLSRDTKR